MTIYSALYYPGDLTNPLSLIRDNRWYPGKAAATFPVWWSYLRKHSPDTRVVLFADTASPISPRALLDALPEPYCDTDDPVRTLAQEGLPAVHVRWLSEH